MKKFARFVTKCCVLIASCHVGKSVMPHYGNNVVAALSNIGFVGIGLYLGDKTANYIEKEIDRLSAAYFQPKKEING